MNMGENGPTVENKPEGLKEKIERFQINVVGYFREKLNKVLDRIGENPYFETER